MISIAINIVLCLSFMCYVNYKGRLNVFSVCLLLFYIFVLIGSFFCLFLDLYTLNNNLYSVFIFTFQYLICVYPFVRNNYNVLDVVVPSNKRITWYYIISSLLFVFFIVSYLSRSIPILLLGNYHDVYVEMRGDDASLYLNKFEYILLQFVSYFTIPSFCVSFALISRGFLFKGGVLILLSVFSSIIFSVFMASRTDLFQVFILLFVVYMFFRKNIQRRYVRFINIILLFVTFVLAFLGMAITLSRFENYSNDLWLFDYFGASILNYDIVFNNTIVFSNGHYFFKNFYSYSPYFYVKNFPDFAFIPLCGRFFIDFKYWGILFSFLSLLFLVRKKQYTIADLFVVLTVFKIVLIGILYSEFNFSILIMNIITFVILKCVLYKSIKIVI